jgi:hypothetical protein
VLEAQTDSEQHQIREFEIVEVRDLQGKKKTGRPLRVTEARFRRMLELVREGHTNTAACRIEKIAYSTWRGHVQHKPEWRERLAEAEKVRDEVWRDFALEMVRSAMPRHWAAAMTFLERRYPLEFSLRVPNRPPNPADESESEPLPSELLAEHRRLALELLREDSQCPE